eukprot:UN08328
MGACIGRTMQKMKYKTIKRVLMVGLDNAGKTTILYKLALEEIVSTVPTVGLNIETIHYKDIKFHVWDLGGQQKIRKMWTYYYEDTDAIIFVIDSNEPQRIDQISSDNAKDELHKLLENKLLKDATLLILANKQDLPNAINVNEVIKRLDLESLINRTWMIQETCAMSGDGLYEGLEWLSNKLDAKKPGHGKKQRPIRNTQKYKQLQ